MQESTNKAWVIRLAEVAQQLWRMGTNAARLTFLQAEPRTNITDGVEEVSFALEHLREMGYIDVGTEETLVNNKKT